MDTQNKKNEFDFVLDNKTKITVQKLHNTDVGYRVVLRYGKWPHRDDLINICAKLDTSMVGEDRVCDADISTPIWDDADGCESRAVFLNNE